ncbi:hypothetical protein [Streptomyces spinosirectus]
MPGGRDGAQEELARRIPWAAERRGLRSGTRGPRVSKRRTGRTTPDEAGSQPRIAEPLGIGSAAVAHFGRPNWLLSRDEPLPFALFIACTSGSFAALAHQWAMTEHGPFPRRGGSRSPVPS